MTSYDAFISYSHAEDRGVARRLQVGLEKFAKPWHRVRASRVFLDDNSLSANPHLWSSVERALANSSWFVLVASPRAAGSKWVAREIEWWLKNRSPERLLIVVSDGDVRWDASAEDFVPSSTALPPPLFGAFAEEPRWVTVPPPVAGNPEPSEAELRDTVIDLATAIRGISKEELVGVATREHKRTMRWVRGVIAGLTLLLALAVIAGLVALDQRSTAIDQAQLALSRQIASVSREAAETDLSTSMLLAVEAYERDPNPETRAALFAANTASPHLEHFLDAGGKVERLAGSSDGDVVAGLADGRVLFWRGGAGEPQQLFRLQRRISSLAVSGDGSVVAAADRAQGSVWQEGEGVSGLPVPVGEHTDQVALSPSGETLVYHALLPGYEEGGSITVASTSALEAGRVHPLSPSDLGYGALLIVPSEQRMLMMIGGSWRWRRLLDWALVMSSEGGFGAHQYGQAVSADGRFFTATNGAQVVPVWPTSKPTSDLGTSNLGVEAPITNQRALALSPDGSKAAVAGGEGIFVAPVATASELRPDSFDAVEAPTPEMDPILLTGQGSSGLLAFVDDMHLLSAAGAEIAVWDLAQGDRLAGRTTVPLMPGCSACPPADIAISPDGERVAVTDDYGSSGFVQSLRQPADREELPESEFRWGSPVWAGDGDFAAFPVYPSFGAPEIPADLPEHVRAWQGAAGERDVLSAATAPDGKTAILVDEKGNVYWQDVETGEQKGHLDAPDSLALGGETLDGAAVSSSPEMAALVDDGKVILEELPSGRELARIEAGEFATAAFAGDRLLVQRQDGALEIWSRQGAKLQRTLAGDENYAYEPVGSRDGRMVARRRSDGSVVLVDLDTGTELATFRTREPSSFLRTSVAFSPAGDRLYMLSEMSGEEQEAELVSRDISVQALMENACRAAGRDLTAREWQAFVGGDPPSDLSCG